MVPKKNPPIQRLESDGRKSCCRLRILWEGEDEFDLWGQSTFTSTLNPGLNFVFLLNWAELESKSGSLSLMTESKTEYLNFVLVEMELLLIFSLSGTWYKKEERMDSGSESTQAHHHHRPFLLNQRQYSETEIISKMISFFI